MSEAGLLSSVDVLEIKKFALGRSHIEDLTATSNAWPAIDPFADFRSIDLSSDTFPFDQRQASETITKAWEELESKLQQVNAWQDERDSIEAEAARFEVGDMERLREVAKAASERELSPHDTDLIELTVQTLVSLDTLLRLLRSRRETLDVYQARLQWEERRRDCYSSYISLSRDMDEFVKQARWSPAIYQKRAEEALGTGVAIDQHALQQGLNIGSCSPETNRSTPNAGLMSSSAAKRRATLVKNQSTALSHRSRSFMTEVVPASATQLDELIELRKVPDAFLDEQDKIEDLAETIRSQDVFLIQLSLQWRKADETFRILRSLHAEGKKLHVAISSAHRESTTRNMLLDFDKQTEVLKKRLEGLCGKQAVEHYFNLKDYTISSDRLFSAIESSIPVPTCERWNDQEIHAKELKECLDKEMCTAAKYARSACQAAARYEKAVSSLEEIQDCISDTMALSSKYAILHKDIRQCLSGKQSPDDGHKCDSYSNSACPALLSEIEALQDDEYGLRLTLMTDLESRSKDLEPRASNQIELLQRGLTACVKAAVPLQAFRNEAEAAHQELDEQKSKCIEAMTEARNVALLAQELRDVSGRLDQLFVDSGKMMKVVKSEASRIRRAAFDEDMFATSSVYDWRIQLDLDNEECSSIADLVKGMSTRLKVAGANRMQEALASRLQYYLAKQSSIEECRGWLDSAHEQRVQLSTLKKNFDQVLTDAINLKQHICKKSDHKPFKIRLPEEEERQVGLGEFQVPHPAGPIHAIDQYVSSAHQRIILVGPLPSTLQDDEIEDESKRSVDEAARNQVNEWCSLLSSAAQELKSEIADADREEREFQLQLQSLADQQIKFAACLYKWDRLSDENVRAMSDLEDKAREDLNISSALESLQKSLQKQEAVLGEVMEVVKGTSLTTAAQAKCEQCQEEMNLMKKQLGELLDSMMAQVQHDEAAVAKKDNVMIGECADGSRHEQINGNPQEAVQKSQLARVETLIEEPRRRVNGRRKSKVHGELEAISSSDIQKPPFHSVLDSRMARALPESHDSFSTEALTQDMTNAIPMSTPDFDVRLQQKAKELAKVCTGGLIDEQTSASGRKQLQNGLMLPTTEQADEIKGQWTKIKSQVEESVRQCQLRSMTEESERLRSMMQVRDAKMRRFTLLAAFASQHAVVEKLLSSLLDRLDGPTEADSAEAIQSCLDDIDFHLKEIELVAESVLTDVRVRHQLGQLRHSYQDMAEMAKENQSVDVVEVNREALLPSRASTNSSLPSLCGSVSEEDEDFHHYNGRDRALSTTTLESMSKLSQPPATPRMLSSKSGSLRNLRNRTYSNASAGSSRGIPIAIPRSTPQLSLDRRSVSESTAMTTPSRMPLPISRSDKGLPATPSLTPRHANNHSVTGTHQFKTPQRIPHTPARPSTAQSYNDLQRKLAFSRSPSTGLQSEKTPKAVISPSKTAAIKGGKPNQYRANPKSKLDVAVAKIVNKMPMQVNITHATVRDTKAKEQWHDESGRYWVGHPDPKLCFCRILRSRTVMVRIGGGWQELSTYIVKHYNHLAPDATVSIAPSPHVSPQIERNNLDELHWADSSTLLATPVTARKASTSNGRFGSAKASPESSHLTPLTNIDWKRESPRGAVKSGKNATTIMSDSAARAASPLPNMPQQPKFEVEKTGLWIRQERRTSQGRVPTPPNSSFDSVLKSKMDGMCDAAKSTISGRSRRLSTNPPNWPFDKVHPISRIMSNKAKRDVNALITTNDRIASTASSRRAPRSSLSDV